MADALFAGELVASTGRALCSESKSGIPPARQIPRRAAAHCGTLGKQRVMTRPCVSIAFFKSFASRIESASICAKDAAGEPSGCQIAVSLRKVSRTLAQQAKGVRADGSRGRKSFSAAAGGVKYPDRMGYGLGRAKFLLGFSGDLQRFQIEKAESSRVNAD